MERQDRSLLIWGGISGVVMTIVYGVGQSLPAADIEVTPSALMQIFFWTAAAFGSLGVINSFAIYTVLTWERQGATNRLALLMSLLAYAIVTIMLLVQGSVAYFAMDSSADSSNVYLLRAVDLGMDLAWDIFMGTSLVLTAGVMWRHSRFGLWWSTPALVLGALLIVFNGITAPIPPASAGLVDVGPATALYGIVMSAYIIRLGTQIPRPYEPLASSTPSGVANHPDHDMGKDV